MLIEWWTELRDWLAALSPEFAFLLALPMAVGIAGMFAHWRERKGNLPRTDADKVGREGTKDSLSM